MGTPVPIEQPAGGWLYYSRKYANCLLGNGTDSQTHVFMN